MRMFSIQQLMKMGNLPYRSRYGIIKLIKEGYLKAVVKKGKGIGTRYFIPEVAIQECNKLFFADLWKNAKKKPEEKK